MVDNVASTYSQENAKEAFWRWLTKGGTQDPGSTAPSVSGAGASKGTPALTLGTTNAAGSASTYVATDATVLTFDATAPTTQAFADAAAVGTASTAAHRDHKHAMPANPVSQGAWTSFSPSWTATGTAPAIGNGTLAGAYQQLGKTIHCRINMLMGSTTTYGTNQWRLSLPVAGVASQGGAGIALCYDTSAGFGYVGMLWAQNVAGQIQIFSQGAGEFTSAVPFTWANGDRLELVLTYEAA